jgi:hypothetical protein
VTPELRDLADACLRAFRAHQEDLADDEKWMVHRPKSRNNARVGALNSLVKRYKDGRLARGDIPSGLAVDVLTFRDRE